MQNGCDSNALRNCTINVGTTSTAGRAVYVQYDPLLTPEIAAQSDTIEYNQLNGGEYGIQLYGGLPNTLTHFYVANNEVLDFLQFRIYFAFTQNSIIKGNRIHHTETSTIGKFGIYNEHTTDNIIIDGNWVYNFHVQETAIVYGIYSPVGINRKIINNMISIDPVNSGACYGIYVGNDMAYVVNNTVRIGGVSNGSGSYGIMFTTPGTDEFANNIVLNERTNSLTGNGQYCLYVSSSAPWSYSDFNLVTTVDSSRTDNRFAFRIDTTDYNQLEDYRLDFPQWDLHSINSAVNFISTQGLHIDTLLPTVVESAGINIADVVRDFDGDLRNPATPDIGADEGQFRTFPMGSLSGVVFDSLPEQTPIIGARVTAGSYSAITDNVGSYRFDRMIAGQYRVVASCSCYLLDSALVVIDSAQQLVHDFDLPHPLLQVSPESIEQVVPTGSSNLTQITMSNNGSGPEVIQISGSMTQGNIQCTPNVMNLAAHSEASCQARITVDSLTIPGTVITGELDLIGDYCPSPTVIPIQIDVDANGIKSNNNILPSVNQLYQNYPNPFNLRTEIRFGLKKTGHTTLKISDISGRDVACLCDQNLSAAYHSVTFDAARFASGIYFYRLESGDVRLMLKMVFLK